jgi:hypothetical protein
MFPARVWDALHTQIKGGTYVKAPESTMVWLIHGGHRTPAAAPWQAWTIPTRVLGTVPLG